MVYPFAQLVNQVGPTAPRLLLNNTLTGPFKLLEQRHGSAGSVGVSGGGRQDSQTQGASCSGGDFGGSASFRDAAFVGDCDDGVDALCKALGWTLED